jgi:probable F420-dependent oxidoreductase
MLLGVNLPNYGTLGTRASVVSIAETAESLGYESVWTTDHVLVPNSLPSGFFGNLLESLMTLSFLAARTERIRIGTGILVLPQRDPILVAKQVATLQHLSAGRLSVAVAVGYVEQEYELLRSPYARRGALLDEYLPAVRELLEAPQPSFHGDTITFDDVYFSPPVLTRVPLFVGGSSAASLRRAATLGDGWYALKQTPDEIAAALATIRRHQPRPGFETSLRIATRVGGPVPDAEPGQVLQGSITDVANAATAFATAGVDRLVIEPIADELEDFLDQLRLFAAEVVPLLPV